LVLRQVIGTVIPAAASPDAIPTVRCGGSAHPDPLSRVSTSLGSASLSVLYLGPNNGTSLDRANSIRRLGHRLHHIDLRRLLPQTPWMHRVTWKLGGHVFAPWVLKSLPKELAGKRYDVCLVDSGEWVTPSIIELLRRHADKVANYVIDDPFGRRDVARFRAYRRSLRHYDLCVVVRPDNAREARDAGAKRVRRVFMSSDEVTHAPRLLTEEDKVRWATDVLFLGTWFPERGPFLMRLIHLGVPLVIRGTNWNKAPEWRALRSSWKSGAIIGDDYAKAIQCAKVNIGLLSKGNRDLHTTRSLEIPALGGLLCAERTSEHLDMYVEGVEALFWSDAEECAAACRWALGNEEERRKIAAAGQMRNIANQIRNENVMSEILAGVFADS
jgi:spore maturation protein CgeB